MKIIQAARAGTFESSDVLVKVSPTDSGLEVVINSEVIKQFGDQIAAVVQSTLQSLGVTEGLITLDDKGALDCVIRARLQSAVLRGAQADVIGWETL